MRSTALALALALTLPTPSHAGLCGGGPLEVLLTNDDGISAPGLAALRERLRAQGHRVTVAAPDHNASGSGTSLAWRDVRVTTDAADPRSFAVSGTPATAVVLAVTALYPPDVRPDLVISGMNDGENAGALLAVSGTVGAALAGTLLPEPIPGMALNAPRLEPREPVDSPANVAHLAQAADYFARFVATTRDWFCEDGDLIRGRTVLNVNYPARSADRIRGTAVVGQARETDLRVQYVDTGNGLYSATTSARATGSAREESDRIRLTEGYVTVTPLSAGLEDESVPRRALARRLRKLEP